MSCCTTGAGSKATGLGLGQLLHQSCHTGGMLSVMQQSLACNGVFLARS